MYNAKYTRVSVCLHCFNWLQAIRLLATRGHYSIDLIIGYVVAVWVSSPAERMGLYYSQGILQLDRYPSFMETFEILIGVDVSKNDKGEGNEEIAALEQPSSRAKSVVGSHHDVESETSVRIAVDIVSSQMKRE